MDGATGGGGGYVNSVDSWGDVTYPHFLHDYTTLGKHSLPRGDVAEKCLRQATFAAMM
jgi:hypothetical protein